MAKKKTKKKSGSRKTKKKQNPCHGKKAGSRKKRKSNPPGLVDSTVKGLKSTAKCIAVASSAAALIREGKRLLARLTGVTESGAVATAGEVAAALAAGAVVDKTMPGRMQVSKGDLVRLGLLSRIAADVVEPIAQKVTDKIKPPPTENLSALEAVIDGDLAALSEVFSEDDVPQIEMDIAEELGSELGAFVVEDDDEDDLGAFIVDEDDEDELGAVITDDDDELAAFDEDEDDDDEMFIDEEMDEFA